MKLDYTRIIGLVVVGISITVIFGTMLPQNDMDHSENLSEPITENSNPLIVMVAPSIHEKYYNVYRWCNHYNQWVGIFCNWFR